MSSSIKFGHRAKHPTVDLAAIEHQAAFSRAQFCARYSICIATFNNWQKAGIGPRVMRVGGRVLVSREAESEWRHRVEGGDLVMPKRGRPRKAPEHVHVEGK